MQIFSPGLKVTSVACSQSDLRTWLEKSLIGWTWPIKFMRSSTSSVERVSPRCSAMYTRSETTVDVRLLLFIFERDHGHPKVLAAVAERRDELSVVHLFIFSVWSIFECSDAHTSCWCLALISCRVRKLKPGRVRRRRGGGGGGGSGGDARRRRTRRFIHIIWWARKGHTAGVAAHGTERPAGERT